MLFHSWSHLILTAALWHDYCYPTLQMRRLRLWEVKWLRWGHRVQESWKSKTIMVPVNHTIWVGGFLTIYSFPSSLSCFKLKGSRARCLLIKNEIVCYNLLQNVCLITTNSSPTKSLNWIQIACLMLYNILQVSPLWGVYRLRRKTDVLENVSRLGLDQSWKDYTSAETVVTPGAWGPGRLLFASHLKAAPHRIPHPWPAPQLCQQWLSGLLPLPLTLLLVVTAEQEAGERVRDMAVQGLLELIGWAWEG